MLRDKRAFGRKSYTLLLANKQGWEFNAERNALPFLERFAFTTKLTPGSASAYPKMLFIEREYRQKGLSENLRKQGWNKVSLGAVTLWRHKRKDDIICELVNVKKRELRIISMQSALQALHHKVIERGGLPVHAALIQKNGKGALITAPGDTGKTTCCRRIPFPWKSLCDDEALIVRRGRKKFFAHPFPTWSDHLLNGSRKRWDIQKNVPLAGIFFLKQARKDALRPIKKVEAIYRLNSSAYSTCNRAWNECANSEKKALKAKLFNNICDLLDHVPAYTLKASLTGKFWSKIESVL